MPGPKRYFAEHSSGYRAEWNGGPRIHIYEGEYPVDSPTVPGYSHAMRSSEVEDLLSGVRHHHVQQVLNDWVDENGSDYMNFNHPTAMRRRAISEEEERELTNLPPLDFDRDEPSTCSNCGSRLAPGESGLCPQCESDSGGRGQRQRQRQKQKMVRTRGGGVERQGMFRVLAGIWDEAQSQHGEHHYHDSSNDPECSYNSEGSEGRCWGHYTPPPHGTPKRDFTDARDKYNTYRGRKNFVPIANNTWLWKDQAGNHHVRHHHTDIMSFAPNGDFTVNPAGWNSVTTNRRLHSLLPHGYSIYTNPSRARSAPKRLMDTPSGKHAYEDGISFNVHTHERVDNDAVRPQGEAANPPSVRGGGDPSEPEPRSNWGSQSWNPPSGYGSGAPTPERRYNPNYTMPQVRHYQDTGDDEDGDYERHNQHNQYEPYDSGGGSTHREVGDTYANPYSERHHDMPQAGESFEDWMKRTAPQPRFDKCDNCRGKGTVRQGPELRRGECGSCKGSGFLTNDGHPAHVDESGRLHDPRNPGASDPNPGHGYRGMPGSRVCQDCGQGPDDHSYEHGHPAPQGTPTRRGLYRRHPYEVGNHGCGRCGEHPSAHPGDSGTNVWGTSRDDVGENHCPECEQEYPRHYDNCPFHSSNRRQSRRQAARQVDLEEASMRYLSGLRQLAYGEQKAPTSVDTLRDEDCPVCGEHDAYNGDQCEVCGFVAPPKMFQDPDLDKAHLMDLRQDPATGEPNSTDMNLPPVDPTGLNDNGQMRWPPDGPTPQGPADQGVVNVEVQGLEDEMAPGPDLAQQQMQQIQETGQPLTPEQLGPNGEVQGGPEDPEAAATHFNQGGEPFTPGPNAPQPAQPQEAMEEQEEEEEQEQQQEQAPTGQEYSQGPDAGKPGKGGDEVPDLMCPACGFTAGAAQPTSMPNDVLSPANAGDGMLDGDVCPSCGQATLMGVGEMQQQQQQMQQQVPVR